MAGDEEIDRPAGLKTFQARGPILGEKEAADIRKLITRSAPEGQTIGTGERTRIPTVDVRLWGQSATGLREWGFRISTPSSPAFSGKLRGELPSARRLDIPFPDER